MVTRKTDFRAKFKSIHLLIKSKFSISNINSLKVTFVQKKCGSILEIVLLEKLSSNLILDYIFEFPKIDIKEFNLLFSLNKSAKYKNFKFDILGIEVRKLFDRISLFIKIFDLKAFESIW